VGGGRGWEGRCTPIPSMQRNSEAKLFLPWENASVLSIFVVIVDCGVVKVCDFLVNLFSSVEAGSILVEGFLVVTSVNVVVVDNDVDSEVVINGWRESEWL